MKKYHDITKKAVPVLAGAGTVAASALPVLAEDSAMSSVQSALTTSFTSVGSSITSAITSILPIALPIIGVGIVIFAGIKIFKKVTGKI